MRRHQYQVQLAATMRPGEDVERLSFKWVVTPDDRHSFRIVVTVVVMGSVSGGLAN